MKFFKQILPFLWSHKRLTLLCIAIIIVGYIVYPKPLSPVPVQKATYQTFTQSISVSGTVVAKNTVNMTFPVSGKLVYVGVKKGDYVWTGQTIAVEDQQIVLKNLQSALLSYANQRNTFDQKLYDTKDNPTSETLHRILATNQNDLDKAVVSVELQDLARQQAILTSPINGIVTRADTENPGPEALAGSTTFTITDPSSLAFAMDVDQADIGKVDIGQDVSITLDAYSSESITGKVHKIDFVSHVTTNGGNAFTVEVVIPQQDLQKYRIGMNGNATIVLSQRQHILTIPIASLVNDNAVWVKSSHGFIKRNISLGQENDTDAEVIKGIRDGDIIALNPILAEKQKSK